MEAPLSALAVLRTHAYAYPLLEVVHILGIALSGQSGVAEAAGVGRGSSVARPSPWRRATLWLVGGGFALVATSGLLMFGQAGWKLIGNRAFC